MVKRLTVKIQLKAKVLPSLIESHDFDLTFSHVNCSPHIRSKESVERETGHVDLRKKVYEKYFHKSPILGKTANLILFMLSLKSFCHSPRNLKENIREGRTHPCNFKPNP